jgi:tRNA pseudouridine55 synthase
MPAAGKKASPPFGFLNIAKPKGVTAHDVVNSARKILGIKQVGHAGTLDPLATGVLPLAVGKATRLLRFLSGDKVYLAEIKLGLKTTTDDITGDAISQSEAMPEKESVVELLRTFIGEQMQVPPIYSAIHLDGKRLYELARRGEAPEEVPSRPVRIDSIEVVSFAAPLLTVRVSCSAGTYIRSIARDVGDKLGCGACLNNLVREQAGPFSLSHAMTLEQLKEICSGNNAEIALLPPEDWLSMDRLELDAEQSRKLKNGMSIQLPSRGSGHVLALADGKLIAVCQSVADSDPAFVRIQPEVVVSDVAQ